MWLGIGKKKLALVKMVVGYVIFGEFLQKRRKSDNTGKYLF